MVRQNLISARGNKTQSDVAVELGISQKYLSKIELGHRTPSAALLAKMLKYYKIPLDTLFPDIFLLNDTPNSSKR